MRESPGRKTVPVTEGPSINFEAVLDSLDAAVVVLDLYGVLLYANERAGEMLDWEAPTGGYLLQACFSTGMAAANGAKVWLGLTPAASS